MSIVLEMLENLGKAIENMSEDDIKLLANLAQTTMNPEQYALLEKVILEKKQISDK